MKWTWKIVTFIILILIFFTVVQAQEFKSHSETLVKGQMEVGVLAPFRWAVCDSLEISTHPLLFFSAPNANLKWVHPAVRGFGWASEHGFLYPTGLLRLLARKGTGGFISPEFEIPHMIAFYNGIVFYKEWTENQIVSLSAGVKFALKGSRLDKRTTIDLPFIYSRLAVFYSGYQLLTGMTAKGALSERWQYHFSVSGFFADDYAMENSAYIAWNSKGRTQVRAGYYLSYARYPFGVQAHLIVPVLDVVWRFK